MGREWGRESWRYTALNISQRQMFINCLSLIICLLSGTVLGTEDIGENNIVPVLNLVGEAVM